MDFKNLGASLRSTVLARASWPAGKGVLCRFHSSCIGVAGGIGIWGAGDWHWGAWSALTAAGLVLAGAQADRLRLRKQAITHDATASFIAGTDQLGRDVLPVWSAHIESSRAQMEDAVAALTQRFAGIVDRLDQALKASTQGGDQGVAGVFENSGDALRGVLDSLRAAMASNGAMHVEVQSLSRFVDELQQMASEVASIAAQTNLLAINARIEAAHAGDSGRSFGVLAQEVRKLSAMSAETGKRMGEKVKVISAAIAAAHRSAEDSAQRESASAVASEAAIHGVLAQFRSVTEVLEASADVLKQESVGIQSEIVEALVQLQFQDRVSQRMTHVRHSIERLPVLLADSRQSFEDDGRLTPVDAAALLAELESSYAMADERATHSGGGGKNASVAATDDVVFF
jgi:methyl-accepting chemotaxis protein